MISTIKLSALDTLFFGNGKPFSMTEDSWTDGIFPPYPETLFGFLKGSFFKENMSYLNLAGDPIKDPTKNLKILDYGIMLEKEGVTSQLYPCPLDFALIKSTNKYNSLKILELEKINTNVISNHTSEVDFKLMFQGSESFRKPYSTYYITSENLNKYLNENYSDINYLDIKDFINIESKIGIRRDRYNTNNKSIYRINLNRTKKEVTELSLWIKYSGINLSLKINRLGGEGKLVLIEKYNLNRNHNETIYYQPDDIIRIYLSTPAITDEGWRIAIKGAKLLTAAIGKPIFIGGFDVEKRYPKPMKKFVPPGSVYYYKVTEKNIQIPSHIGLENNKGYGKIFVSKITNKSINT